jgi:hypothetical protein
MNIKMSMAKFGIKRRAELDGSSHYWTGKKCKRGHIDWRNTSTGKCMSCNRLTNKAITKKQTFDSEYSL